MADPEDFPVAEVEAPPRRRRTYPAKGSDEAKAWAQRMKDARDAKRAAGGATPRKTKASSAPRSTGLADVERSLRETFAKGGAMLYMPAPVPGTYIIETGDEAAAIIVRMAERNPKLLAALQGSSNVMDYFAIGAWGVGLMVAFAVQAGRTPADAPIAQTFGITKIVDDLTAEGSLQVEESGPITTEIGTPAGVQSSPAWVVPTPNGDELLTVEVPEE
jgi:hypothetical protein